MLPKNLNLEDFKYREPNGRDLLEFLDVMESLLKGFAARAGIARETFTFNTQIIFEIAVRLDQRRDYYHYFHSKPDKITEMSQSKKLALLCYWIIRYKPFIQNRDLAQKCYEENKCTINELIALFIFKMAIISMPDVDYDKAVQALYDGDTEKSLIHTFMHTDVTKESMIQLLFSLEMAFKA
jgi:hypothetical protein